MDAFEISETGTNCRPAALMRDTQSRGRRDAAAAVTPLRRQRATLSLAQLIRAAMLLAAGFACAAGLRAGSAGAQTWSKDGMPAHVRMVNGDR
ncbi:MULTISPECIES: hypothetical protein [Methylosinus]|uniref:Uncharacterized protein n=1 Tax=Methylosinus trichosporium (strain ATCC 35070 / NCIMB 11131 / UNIQEM 75 / OB3b) TaxID=595536 RepID=A0A2D2CVE9_METT3|nr:MULTISPECIES: hypothetical protein [Methylosinus]ATQ66616.1 hypothetical protein CQW49_00930 [Methylosinus trichosporium OB3b]OBS51695.1 hypothetical protein A8B73_14815 [Methylosinus sp. 3S-1]